MKQNKTKTMKMYKTRGIKEHIEEVDYSEVMSSRVWFTGDDWDKENFLKDYWNTLEEAKEFLRKEYEKIIKTSEMKIESAKKALKEIEEYKN